MNTDFSKTDKPKRVLLINPPQTQPKQSVKRCIVPMGLAYIAAYLEKRGHIVKIIDCIVEGYNTESYHGDKQMTFGLTEEEVKNKIKEFKPDFVGVSAMMSSESHNTHNVCKWIKGVDENIQVFVGGAHASAIPEHLESDENIDHVVFGEGEESTRKIVEEESSGTVSSDLIDVKDIPWPARHLLTMEKYIKIDMPTSVFGKKNRTTQVETSRGCPFNCCFCCTTHFWGRKWRARDPDDIVSELKFLKEEYNIKEIDFTDSNLIVNKERMIELCKKMIPLKLAWANPGGVWAGGLDKELLYWMKKSGCYQVTFAVENANPHILNKVIHKPLKDLDKVKDLVKYCHKIGIDTHAFFVMGFPEESIDSMKKTFKWALDANFTSATFNIVQPLPGSEMWDKYKKEGLKDLKHINLRYATIPHPEIKKEELEKMIDEFNTKFNSSAWHRNPKMFALKYIRVALKRHNLKFIKRMFKRQ